MEFGFGFDFSYGTSPVLCSISLPTAAFVILFFFFFEFYLISVAFGLFYSKILVLGNVEKGREVWLEWETHASWISGTMFVLKVRGVYYTNP